MYKEIQTLVINALFLCQRTNTKTIGPWDSSWVGGTFYTLFYDSFLLVTNVEHQRLEVKYGHKREKMENERITQD